MLSAAEIRAIADECRGGHAATSARHVIPLLDQVGVLEGQIDELRRACEAALQWTDLIMGIYRQMSPRLKADGTSVTMEPVRQQLRQALRRSQKGGQ